MLKIGKTEIRLLVTETRSNESHFTCQIMLYSIIYIVAKLILRLLIICLDRIPKHDTSNLIVL